MMRRRAAATRGFDLTCFESFAPANFASDINGRLKSETPTALAKYSIWRAGSGEVHGGRDLPPPAVPQSRVAARAPRSPPRAMTWLRRLPRSQWAAADAGDDVVAVGCKKVAVARTRNARAGRERPAAQHLAGVEPGARIVFVRISREARERHEIRCRPFPHVADHLSAAERAVARGTGGHI